MMQLLALVSNITNEERPGFTRVLFAFFSKNPMPEGMTKMCARIAFTDSMPIEQRLAALRLCSMLAS